MNDYLEAESLIVARLEDQVQDAQVHSSWGKPVIKETHELPPSVMVFLEDDKPGATAANGKDQKIEQIWLALVVVRDAENDAGPLISQVIRAMAGWKLPSSRFSPFQRVKSAFSPDYSPNGVFYFPIAFSTTFVFNIP